MNLNAAVKEREKMIDKLRIQAIAPGEYWYIPSTARESFFRPGFAYTNLCPDIGLRQPITQRNAEEIRKNQKE